MYWKLAISAAVAAGLAGAINSHEAHAMMASAKADLVNPDGKGVGSVSLEQTPNGVLLTAKLKNLPAGAHAFHVHAVGKCEPPFKSAKGHYNPGNKKHGILTDGGLHAGDMPNVHVPASGALTIEVLNPNITLAKGKPNSVFDADGSAIVMHMKGDDYKSQPSGAAGGRIACGVIK
jgi:Cu-Zn family superoxide dismutase